MAVSNWENPVLSRELRQRMRGSKAFWLLFAFVGILAAILGAAFYSMSSMHASESLSTATIGRQFYTMLFLVQAGLVCLITPALTSGALTLERENHTYEAMEVSLLPRRSIVAGKLASALSFVLFLLSASLPLSAMTFLLGGVAPQEIAVAYLVLAVSAFVYGSLGLAFSSFVKSTVTSTLVSYFAAVAVFLLTGILTVVGSNNLTSGTPIPGRACLVAFNPMGAIGAATMSESYFGVLIPSWLTSLVMNGFLGTLFFLTALHRLEYPKSDRSGLLRGLTAGFVVLTTVGLSGSLISDMLLSNFNLGTANVAFWLMGIGAVLSGVFATGTDFGTGGALRLKLGNARSGLTFSLLTVGICAVAMVGAVATKRSYYVPMASAEAAVALVSTFGIAGLGLAVTRWTKNRWVAMAITLTAALLLFTIPATNRLHSYSETPYLSDYFAFLSPMLAVDDCLNSTNMPFVVNLLQHFFWPITVGFYGLLGTVGIVVANRKGR